LEASLVAAIFAASLIKGADEDFGGAQGYLIGVAVLLVARNSLVTYIIGVGIEGLLRYHQWIGWLTFIPAVMHAYGQGAFWDFAKDQDHITGNCAFILMLCMGLLASPPVRAKFYTLFYWAHISLAGTFGVTVLLHAPKHMGKSLLVPASLYLVDHLIRQRRRHRKAFVNCIEQLPESEIVTIYVEVPGQQRFHYEAGQMAWVQIPRISRWAWHPLSFSSSPRPDGVASDNIVSFHVRPAGRWTSRIRELLPGDQVRFDGPYGEPSVPYLSCDSVFLVAAGVGVTPMMSILRNLLDKIGVGVCCGSLTRVYFTWVTRSQGDFLLFQEEILRALEQTKSCNPELSLSFDVSLHVTSNDYTPGDDPPSIHAVISQGRPDLEAQFSRVAAECTASNSPMPSERHKRVAVMVCGPHSLQMSVAAAAEGASSTRCKFHVHSEAFAL
jgi:NAD(P)H-flavin reductase